METAIQTKTVSKTKTFVGVGLAASFLLAANGFAIANSLATQKQTTDVKAAVVQSGKKLMGVEALKKMQTPASAPALQKAARNPQHPAFNLKAYTPIDGHVIRDLHLPPAGAKYLTVSAAAFNEFDPRAIPASLRLGRSLDTLAFWRIDNAPGIPGEDGDEDPAPFENPLYMYLNAPVTLPDGAVPFELRMEYIDTIPGLENGGIEMGLWKCSEGGAWAGGGCALLNPSGVAEPNVQLLGANLRSEPAADPNILRTLTARAAVHNEVLHSTDIVGLAAVFVHRGMRDEDFFGLSAVRIGYVLPE